MHDFIQNEISPFETAYAVKNAVTGAADTDLIVVYKIDAPAVEVTFLAKYLKEGVNP